MQPIVGHPLQAARGLLRFRRYKLKKAQHGLASSRKALVYASCAAAQQALYRRPVSHVLPSAFARGSGCTDSVGESKHSIRGPRPREPQDNLRSIIPLCMKLVRRQLMSISTEVRAQTEPRRQHDY
jgi:hypothetical protein